MAQHDSDFEGQSPSGETASNAANNSPNISQSGQITSICDDITPNGTGSNGGGSGPTIVAQTITPTIREQKGSKYVIKDLVRTLPAYLNNGTPGSSFPDLFRARSGYFWYRDDKYSTKPLLCVAKDRRSADTSSFDNYLADGISKVRFPIENFTIPRRKDNNNSIGFHLEETLNMTYLQLESWYEGNNIIGPILSAIDNKKFLDIVFDIERPTEQTAENSSLAPGKLLIKVENEYNAYVSLYEKALSENDISSKVLPNMYLLLAENLTDPRNLMNIEEEKRQGISSDAYQQALDLEQTSNWYPQKMIVGMDNNINNLSSNGDEYIDRFSRLLSSPTSWRNGGQNQRDFWLAYTSRKMTNLVFSSREIKLFREFKSFREQFPFYININIDSPDLKTIGNSFYKSGFIDYLMAYVAKERENNKKVFRIGDNAFEEETRDATQDFFDIKNIFSNLKTRQEIFTNIPYTSPVRTVTGDITYVGLLEKDIIGFDSMEPSEKMDLSFLELEYDLLTNDLKNRYLRTMKDCFEGKSAYSEVLFYRIDKYEHNSAGTAQFLQSFFVPSTDEDKIDLTDTQIKYGKKYEYRIYSYNYVLGNEYEYIENDLDNTGFQLFPPGAGSRFVKIKNDQKGFLVDTFQYSIEGIVVDKPGAMPEVQIVPFKDNSENLLFLFNPSTVEYNFVDIPFNNSEIEMYNKVRQTQQKMPGEKLRFGGDDKVKEYYIYRIEKYPKSYEDFYEAFYKSVRTKCNCTSAEMIESIEPNKKYYYIFRSIDVHNNISYPSPVYEVELINENQMIFLKKDVVPFRDKEYKKSSKAARRLIHIRPSTSQTLITREAVERYENGTDTQVSLGDTNNLNSTVWGKTFKMRIKSKKTNKFVDVKFRFQKESPKSRIIRLKKGYIFVLLIFYYTLNSKSCKVLIGSTNKNHGCKTVN